MHVAAKMIRSILAYKRIDMKHKEKQYDQNKCK